MRKRTPAISFAIAWNAPPRTRSVIGRPRRACVWAAPAGGRPRSPSRSRRHLLRVGMGLRAAASPVAIRCSEAVDARRRTGRMTVVESYWLTIAGPQAGCRPERSAVVVAGRDLLERAADAEHASPSCRRASADSSPGGLGHLERRHQPDPAYRTFGSRRRSPRSGAVLAQMDVVEVGLTFATQAVSMSPDGTSTLSS